MALLAIVAALIAAVVAIVVAFPHVHRSHTVAPVVLPPPKPFRIVFPEGFTRAQMAVRVRERRDDRAAEEPQAGAAERGRRTCVRAGRRRSPASARTSRPTSRASSSLRRTTSCGATTSAQLVGDQLKAFCENWSRVDLTYARSKNLTDYDVLVIASMIEEETRAPEERKLVSAVIYNRLHARMPLGIDATLRYGLHIPPTKSILESQLQSDNAYNTRKTMGLPPTPIANPGLASIQAAAHPAHVDYLYFVRKPDKIHQFFTASAAAFAQYECAHGYGC